MHGAAAAAGTDPFQLPVGRPAGARQGTRLDALIDVIVTLPVDAPVSGEIAVAHLPASRRAGHKPLIIEGLNAESGDWETPVHGQRYSEFQAGVQLANRVGPLNQIEYSEFVQKVQAFAEAVGSMADFPDMLEVVARSRELDAFASPRDLQLAVGLRARAVPWSVGYVQQCGARHGFLPGAVPGRLVLPGAGEGDPARGHLDSTMHELNAVIARATPRRLPLYVVLREASDGWCLECGVCQCL
jgi:hypothetical protein